MPAIAADGGHATLCPPYKSVLEGSNARTKA